MLTLLILLFLNLLSIAASSPTSASPTIGANTSNIPPRLLSQWKEYGTLFLGCLSPLFRKMGQKPSSSISYPLPFDKEMDASSILRGLEYVSRDLRRKREHVHLIVGGSSLSCLVYKSKTTWYGSSYRA
jgi:hypothetical protein